MVSALVVVIVTAVPPAIPAVFQLIHTRTAGQLGVMLLYWNYLQKGFPLLMLLRLLLNKVP